VVKDNVTSKDVKIHISSEEEFEVLEKQLYLKNDLCQYLKNEGVKCDYVVNTSGKSFICGLADRANDGKNAQQNLSNTIGKEKETSCYQMWLSMGSKMATSYQYELYWRRYTYKIDICQHDSHSTL